MASSHFTILSTVKFYIQSQIKLILGNVGSTVISKVVHSRLAWRNHLPYKNNSIVLQYCYMVSPSITFLLLCLSDFPIVLLIFVSEWISGDLYICFLTNFSLFSYLWQVLQLIFFLVSQLVLQWFFHAVVLLHWHCKLLHSQSLGDNH